jgi:predicted DNA-binding transcriptional regulator AlpA
MGTESLRTRAQLMAAYGLGRSTLEKWYRERTDSGHPEAAGTVGRELAWDGAEWDAWYKSRQQAAPAPGLLSRDQLAERHGLSKHALKKLWAEREANGHPPPARQAGKALYWDGDAWAAWYEGLGDTVAKEDPEELVTLAEMGRILGLAPSSVTVYAKRPPAGWPEPVAEEQLGGGRVRRLYRRADVAAYARSKH